jgi:hypothetical protein
MNPGHEAVARVVIEIERRPHLLDAARIHDDDLVRQRQRLDLVMRHVDHGGAEPPLEACELHPHVDAQGGVEVRQRLVEEEDLRLAHDGSTYGDPLPLPPGKLARLAAQIIGNLEDTRRDLDARRNLRFRLACEPQRVTHVLGDRHVRIKRIGLEYHGDSALSGRHVVHDLTVDDDATGRGFVESADQPQERGFATSGGADEDREFSRFDSQVDVLEDFDRVVALRHGFDH